MTQVELKRSTRSGLLKAIIEVNVVGKIIVLKPGGLGMKNPNKKETETKCVRWNGFCRKLRMVNLNYMS